MQSAKWEATWHKNSRKPLPLQQLLQPSGPDPGQPDDPDKVLAKAFKAQAGVLRDLGQRKLQGEQRVHEARVQLEKQEAQVAESPGGFGLRPGKNG